uniref:Uncharacterized protein n=1 Tax=Meloidogyne hapla TaxID=6305 RepID=A0A1I8BRF3_MELHA
MDEEQWRGANKLLKKFLFVNIDKEVDELSLEINEEFNDYYNDSNIHQHQSLDFLLNNEEINNCSLLSPSIFVLVTQPSLLIELIKNSDISDLLQRKFSEFENQKKCSLEELIIFIEKLDLLTVNLDFLVEIKHIIPNLIARIINLLRKFFTDSDGHLIFCNEAQKMALFISHLILASGEDMRFEYFNDINEIESALSEIPNSLSLTKTEEMVEDEKEDNISYKLDILPKKRHHLSATFLGENEERKQKIERAFSLGIFESADLYWLSLLPNKDNQKNRLRLLKSIFSEKWQNANNSRFRPFSILKAYATKFWTKESNTGRTGQIRRPPPHNEWLPLISDYALALKLAQNKTEIRKKMFGLRMFSNNPFPIPPADWLLAAIFISSRLCSDSTIDLLERLILHRE